MTSKPDNIDLSEVSKFEELASRWWDPHSEFKPLHEINPLRLEFIEQRADIRGKKVLDVGCGGGILAEGLAAGGALVTGIDVSDAPLSVAKLHLKESGFNVEYRRATAERYATQHADEFDIVTCMELLEHVPDPASTVSACGQLVRSGGVVFYSTINRNLKAWLFAVIGAEYILGMLPKGTHEYGRFIKPSELDDWSRKAGLVMQEIKGMQYHPFTRRYTLSTDLDVNYLCLCKKV